MADRPTIKLIDNPVALADKPTATPPQKPTPEPSPTKTPPPARRRPRPSAAPSQPVPAPVAAETNPYAGMQKVQAPIRLFPPLWERLEQLVRELRDEGLDVDKTALLNAVLHFKGPANATDATQLINDWRVLLARPPARRRTT